MKNRISALMCAVLAAIFVLSAPLMAGALYIPVTMEDIAEAADSSASLTEEWFGDVSGVTYDAKYTGEELDSAIIDTLALYKAYREGNYLKHGADSVALQRGLFVFADVQKALDNYNARATLLDEMEQRMLLEIVKADVTLKVVNSETKNGKLELLVNEWTFFDYDDLEGEGEAIDVSGYGVDHILTLSKVGDKWLIEDDFFNDTLMGLPEVKTDKNGTAVKSLKDGGLRQAGISAVNGKLTQKASYTIYSGYKPADAVAYSEKWVYHNPTSGNYESYYNPAYYNFNPLGGDCANYTSQSIYAGGMPFEAGAQYGTDGWFYYTSSNRSGSWTGAKELRIYMSNKRGKQVNNPTNAQVWMGCPMFVDWYSDGVYDHAYFCVGQNSSGTAIINSHNSDKYHVKWNYGYSSSTYSTVQITTSNHAIAKTVSAPTITVTTAAAYNTSTSVSWGAVTNATSYKYKVVSYAGEMSATSASTVTGETTTTGTSFSFKTPASGKYCKVTVTAVGPDNSASASKTVMIGPWESYPTNLQYIPINDVNGSQWTTGGSTVWTSSNTTTTFSAVWWTAALCTANSDGSYTVSSVYASGGSSKSVAVSGTNIIIATHSSEANHQYTAALKVGDKITLHGVYLDNGTIRGSGYALVNGGISLAPADITTSQSGVTKLPENAELGMKAFRGISAKTTVATAITYFEQDASFLQIRDRNGNTVTGATTVCTGYTVNIVANGEVKTSYAIIIVGDVNCDGAITSADNLVVATSFVGSAALAAAESLAADINNDAQLTSSDFLALTSHISGANKFE